MMAIKQKCQLGDCHIWSVYGSETGPLPSMEEISQLWNQKLFGQFREKFPDVRYFMVVLCFDRSNIVGRNGQAVDLPWKIIGSANNTGSSVSSAEIEVVSSRGDPDERYTVL
jgi:hypothetical protein